MRNPVTSGATVTFKEIYNRLGFSRPLISMVPPKITVKKNVNII